MQWFSTGGHFALKETFDNIWRHFLDVTSWGKGCVDGSEQVESKDASQYFNNAQESPLPQP